MKKMLSVARRQSRRTNSTGSAWWKVRVLPWESGWGPSRVCDYVAAWCDTGPLTLWDSVSNFVKRTWCTKIFLRGDDIPGCGLDQVWDLEELFRNISQRAYFRISQLERELSPPSFYCEQLWVPAELACELWGIQTWTFSGVLSVSTHDTHLRNKHWALICCSKSSRGVSLLYAEFIMNSRAILGNVF